MPNRLTRSTTESTRRHSLLERKAASAPRLLARSCSHIPRRRRPSGRSSRAQRSIVGTRRKETRPPAERAGEIDVIAAPSGRPWPVRHSRPPRSRRAAREQPKADQQITLGAWRPRRDCCDKSRPMMIPTMMHVDRTASVPAAESPKQERWERIRDHEAIVFENAQRPRGRRFSPGDFAMARTTGAKTSPSPSRPVNGKDLGPELLPRFRRWGGVERHPNTGVWANREVLCPKPNNLSHPISFSSRPSPPLDGRSKNGKMRDCHLCQWVVAPLADGFMGKKEEAIEVEATSRRPCHTRFRVQLESGHTIMPTSPARCEAFYPHRSRRSGSGGALALRPDQGRITSRER